MWVGMSAAELLRATRLERGLSQVELARRAGTTQNHVSRIERGAVSPSLSTLQRLVHATGRRLVLATEPLPSGNATPSSLRSDFRDRTAEERVHEAMELSTFLTGLTVRASCTGRPRVTSETGGEAPPRRRRAHGLPGTQRPLQPAQLLDTLRRHRVEFVVIGGFSLAAHGVVRATKELDIVPEPSQENRSRLAFAPRALEAEVDLGDVNPGGLGARLDEEGLSAGGNWVRQTRLGQLDVMQDVPGIRDYEHLRSGAVEVSSALYAGYDELISMKTATAREEDLRDIGALEAAHAAE
jgi:transcriptional regulator with XRE-family HTH domain